MKTSVYLIATSLVLGLASCSYHEHEKPAPTVHTQTTTSEVVRPVVGPASTTTVRETRTY